MAVPDILKPAQLTKLRSAYNAASDTEMAAILAGIKAAYGVDLWLDGIGSVVFPELSANPAPNLPLAPADRERILIALIAGRYETMNLAIHIYMGLMYDIEPAEICNVLVLAGVYTGISAYVRGIRVAEATFNTLQGIKGPNFGPFTCAGALNGVFASSWGG